MLKEPFNTMIIAAQQLFKKNKNKPKPQHIPQLQTKSLGGLNFFLLAIVLPCQGFTRSINKNFTKLFWQWPSIFQRLSRENVTQVGQDFIQPNTSADCDEYSQENTSASLIYAKVALCSKHRGGPAKCKAWLG